ncbi:MAG: hypothetical protein CXR31_04490 [Geobacter sp.]|nr:MAG: hypothetical protein CXR31_04490 [Geobacter sp.]
MIHTNNPMIQFSIKERLDGHWDFVPLSDLWGRSVRELFSGYSGREVVAEFLVNDYDMPHRWFFCGTDFWLQRMAEKGRACSFAEAITILEERKPDILARVIPGLNDVIDLFPGSVMELCECGNMVSAGQATTETAGVTEPSDPHTKNRKEKGL